MVVYNVITAICFSFIVLLVLSFGVSLLLRDRKGRIEFLRGFKRGKGVFIYVISLPLYVIGHYYAGQNFVNSLLTATTKVINTVVLKYEINSIAALMADNVFYRVTAYLCFIVIALNALLLTLSVFNQYAWAFCKFALFKLSRKKKLIVVGNNERSLSIYRSAASYASVVVDAPIPYSEGGVLFGKNVTYLSLLRGRSVASGIWGLLRGVGKRHYTVVVNTQDDEKNMQVCRDLLAFVLALDEDTRRVYCKGLEVYVIGNPCYADLYEDIAERSFGIIRLVDVYRQVAVDFVDRYPLTSLMTDKQIDLNTSLVRADVDVNVVLVGFGEVNQEIFNTSVANNQFLTMEDGRLQLKKVHYHIFDKVDPAACQKLNHNYYRYKAEVYDRVYPPEGVVPDEQDKLSAEDYLPLPSLPAEEHFYQMDVASPRFYRRLHEILTNKPNDVNCVVISIGQDLANLDLAEKLLEKKREWGVDTAVFVRAKTSGKQYAFMQAQHCYLIADENELYNIDKISGDTLYNMAKMRNEVYDLEYKLTHGEIEALTPAIVEENHRQSERDWYAKKSLLERESSLYCCLSLRAKLHMMGLDYRPVAEEGTPLTEEAYLARYAGVDQPDFDYYGNLTVEGKRIAHYTTNFAPSRRQTMAVQEHYRWNSFMISKGFVPATKAEIEGERNDKGRLSKGKNYAVRRHGNLTTYDGLLAFRRLVAQSAGTTEGEEDVIKYDYQLLDDAYWFLTRCGYKIVERGV